VAILTVFSDNLSPVNSSLSVRFTKATGFFIDAPLTNFELEIDIFLQVYLPMPTGEKTRVVPLSVALPHDTETLITIPTEYVDSGLEMALLFLASSTTYLEAYVIGESCTLSRIDTKLNQITQLITDMSYFLQDSNSNGSATSSTTASVTVSSNTNTISLLAANPNRKRFSLRNKGNKATYIGFSSTFTTANFYLSLAAGAVYESDFSFTGEIFGLAIAANSATDIQVTEFV
jgi:hypothetical protein